MTTMMTMMITVEAGLDWVTEQIQAEDPATITPVAVPVVAGRKILVEVKFPLTGKNLTNDYNFTI